MLKHQSVIKTFDEFYQFDKRMEKEWGRFHLKEQLTKDLRPEIISSWERCKQYGINSFKHAPVIYQGDSLQERREQGRFLLEATIPHIDNFFQKNSNLSWFLTDQDGVILETKLNKYYMNKAEEIYFIPGSDISERASGTNATSIALIEKKTVQVFSSEHYFQSFHPYVAIAAPILDPLSGEILGVLHMAAEKNVVQAHNPFFLFQIIKLINQSMESNILEQNVLAVETMLDMFQEPFILFDNKMTIIRYNTAAKHFLRANSGKLLTNIIDIPYTSQEWNEILQKGMQGVFSGKGKDRSEWKIQIQPYKRGPRILGGMAIFQKKSVPLPIYSGSQRGTRTRYQFSDIVTQDPSMLKVIQLAKKVAFTDKTVLLTGETGTGKEIISQSIHFYDTGHEGPFIEVNCGAIPEELVASELFGYEGGSFTGAKSQGKKGKFLLADQGTIFLDEIGDLPLKVQVYLLRVLEERNVTPIGGYKPIPIRVRVIAATHRNLESEVKKGNFREDLFHRLNMINLRIPPLRERKEDIPLLVQHFLNVFKEGGSLSVLDADVMDALCDYSWPGNVRELKNTVEKLIFYAGDGHIHLNELSQEMRRGMLKTPLLKETLNINENWVLGRKIIDKDILIQTLKKTNGNKTIAAKILNVSRWTIYNRMKDFNLK